MILYKAGSVAVHGVGLGVGLVGWVWGWFKVIVQGVGSGCWFRVLVQSVGIGCWFRGWFMCWFEGLVQGVGSGCWFSSQLYGLVQGLFKGCFEHGCGSAKGQVWFPGW